jgi:hypothetical protein
VFEELDSPMQVVEIVAANPHTPVLGPMPWLTKMKGFLFTKTERDMKTIYIYLRNSVQTVKTLL